MGLADTVRAGVALANRMTKTLQATVTLEKFQSQDDYGNEVFLAPRKYTAIVEIRIRDRQTQSGQLVTTRASVFFIQPVIGGVHTRDRLTLPDGTSGPIVDSGGLVDAETSQPFYHEVWIGLGGSGSRQ
jgi:hypothetical protein